MYSYPSYGLGAAGTTGQKAAASVGAGIVAASPFTGPAAPFVALAGTLVEIFSSVFGGCGSSCTLSSQAANQVEQVLKQNLDAYMAVPTPRPRSVQVAALSVFDQAWNQLNHACGQIGGPGGKNCISDRQSGACHWQNGGQCWNWFVGYRDPIANDPNVVDDSALNTSVTGGITNTVTSIGKQLGLSTSTLALLALGVGAFIFFKD